MGPACTYWPHFWTPHPAPHTHAVHTLDYFGDFSHPKHSIWFMPSTDLEVGEEKQVKQQQQSVTPFCLRQGVYLLHTSWDTHTHTHPPPTQYPWHRLNTFFLCSLCPSFRCSSSSPISICHLTFPPRCSLIIFSLHVLTNFQSFPN